jgi:molybdenum cofactor synthesis domain-containing protein
MRRIDVRDAVGQVICQDMTRITDGIKKDVPFRKGHIIREEDIPVLLAMGKEHIYVWELREGFLHENDAAMRLYDITANAGMSSSEVKEGKIELFAEHDGLFLSDTGRLFAVNSVEDICIAARHSHSPVRKGDKLAGMRVIPLVVDESHLIEAEKIAGSEPVFQLLPYRIQRAGVITTGSEILAGRVTDSFTPVLVRKLREYGIEMTEHLTVGDTVGDILAAIEKMRASDVQVILLTGGMSVDPDDRTPGAVKQSGARIVTYGAPVFPGAMMLLGYYPEGTPVLGLPGCVMYAKATVFDRILPRVAAGIPVTKSDIVSLGDGGLCLGCEPCLFPVCPFGC